VGGPVRLYHAPAFNSTLGYLEDENQGLPDLPGACFARIIMVKRLRLRRGSSAAGREEKEIIKKVLDKSKKSS
jgi:hypothetical protein